MSGLSDRFVNRDNMCYHNYNVTSLNGKTRENKGKSETPSKGWIKNAMNCFMKTNCRVTLINHNYYYRDKNVHASKDKFKKSDESDKLNEFDKSDFSTDEMSLINRIKLIKQISLNRQMIVLDETNKSLGCNKSVQFDTTNHAAIRITLCRQACWNVGKAASIILSQKSLQPRFQTSLCLLHLLGEFSQVRCMSPCLLLMKPIIKRIASELA